MTDVFISYSTHDINRASAIRSLLEKNSITCWMGDKDIHASKTYTEEITKAIKNCHAFLLVLSSHAQESTYVLSEFECAISLRKTIVPIIIENFRINERFLFHIRRMQAIKAYEDWKEAQMDLLNSVRHLLQNIQSKEVMIHGQFGGNEGFPHQPSTTVSNLVSNAPQQNEHAGEITDIRYGTKRIPVKIARNGKYQILCKSCESELISNKNYEVANAKIDQFATLITFSFIPIGLAVIFTLIVFLSGEFKEINNFVLLTVGNPFFWILLILILCLIMSWYEKRCAKKYASKYTPKIDGHFCTQKFYCTSCKETFSVKIPIQDCSYFFFFDSELPGRIYEIGKEKSESILTPDPHNNKS